MNNQISTQSPIACQLYDFIEIACMYNLEVMLTLHPTALSLSWLTTDDYADVSQNSVAINTIKGIAKNTTTKTFDAVKHECIVLSPEHQQYNIAVALTDIAILTAITENPHFSEVHF
mgnify:CR=1 FL=1